jgi:hypothetical protein
MKKLILLYFFVWLVQSDDSPQEKTNLPEIKILSPKDGDIWRIGKQVWVHWDVKSLGDGTDRIDLDLYRGPGGGALLENISFGVPIKESASEWLVKKKLQPGSDYFIVISSPEKQGFRVVSQQFSIGKHGTRGLGNKAASFKQNLGHWMATFFLIGLNAFVL